MKVGDLVKHKWHDSAGRISPFGNVVGIVVEDLSSVQDPHSDRYIAGDVVVAWPTEIKPMMRWNLEMINESR
jgi:hypothetical protein